MCMEGCVPQDSLKVYGIRYIMCARLRGENACDVTRINKSDWLKICDVTVTCKKPKTIVLDRKSVV